STYLCPIVWRANTDGARRPGSAGGGEARPPAIDRRTANRALSWSRVHRQSERAMSEQTVVLNIPDAVYSRLRSRAEQHQRSIEAESLDVIVAAVSAGDDISEVLAGMELLDNDALWRAGRSRLAPEMAAQLEELHDKQQREGLTAEEAADAQRLV